MLNYAILIDGGFAKRKLNGKQPATAEHFKKLIQRFCRNKRFYAKRVY